MADVRPFSAWRYADHGFDISAVTAPPYDVISAEARIALAQRDAENVVALELPEGPADPLAQDNRYTHASRLWDSWRQDGVLAHDATPCVYVLEQRFELSGRPVRRRAFIAAVGLEPFDAGVILPHERTLPKALGDRFELIQATGANLSQVFGLFEGGGDASARLFDRVMAKQSAAVAVDDDGVVSELWACDDATVAGELTDMLAGERIFIADGHHRYTVALAHRDHSREAASRTLDEPNSEPYDFVMMALVDMDDPELVVLPTHRVAVATETLTAQGLRRDLAAYFDLAAVNDESAEEALARVHGPAFVFRAHDDETPWLATLRTDLDPELVVPTAHSSAWKELDVAVLQELVLNPLFDIHPDRPETLERLSFSKDAESALAAVPENGASFVLRATRMDQLRAVALAGETMPQKSTYFHPKLLSGLLFRNAR